MTTSTPIVILGGTGYTGANLVTEALAQGHHVTAVSRTAPAAPVDGVAYLTGSIADEAFRAGALGDAIRAAGAAGGAVIAALAPRGDMADTLRGAYADIAALAGAAGARFLVIGGFSGLRPAEGAPRFVEGDDVPEQFRHEAQVMTDVLGDLQAAYAADGLDWLYISPAGAYGAFAPGERTGAYRTGGDVALFDADGNTAISGADFALAVIDEVARADRHRAHISFAY